MPFISRHRERRNASRPPGAYALLDRYGRVIESGPVAYATNHESCDDVVGNFLGQNPFDLVKHELKSFCSVDGRISRTLYIDYPSGYDQAPVHQPIPESSLKGGLKDATAMIASHAPNQEHVSIPNFIYELKDYPSMLKHAWRRAMELHRVSGAFTMRQVMKYLRSGRSRGEDWLNYKFGWDPLYRDIEDLLEMQKWLDKRMKTFAQFKKRGFIRKRSWLGNQQAVVAGTMNAFRGENGLVTTTASSQHWVVSRWKVTDPFVFEQPLVNQKEFWKQSLGLDFNVIALWNALPWSWMVDWFSNVGALISIKRNRFGVDFDSAVRMTETTYDSTMVPSGAWTGVSTSGTSRYVSTYKKRRTFAPSIFRSDLGLNYLTDSQLTTLASLAVTRRRA